MVKGPCTSNNYTEFLQLTNSQTTYYILTDNYTNTGYSSHNTPILVRGLVTKPMAKSPYKCDNLTRKGANQTNKQTNRYNS